MSHPVNFDKIGGISVNLKNKNAKIRRKARVLSLKKLNRFIKAEKKKNCKIPSYNQ